MLDFGAAQCCFLLLVNFLDTFVHIVFCSNEELVTKVCTSCIDPTLGKLPIRATQLRQDEEKVHVYHEIKRAVLLLYEYDEMKGYKTK